MYLQDVMAGEASTNSQGVCVCMCVCVCVCVFVCTSVHVQL